MAAGSIPSSWASRTSYSGTCHPQGSPRVSLQCVLRMGPGGLSPGIPFTVSVVKNIASGGTWVAQWVKHPTLDFSSGHDLPVCEIEP